VIQVDSDGYWCAGRGAEDDAIDPANESVCLVDSPAPSVSVIVVDDGRGPGMPLAAYLDAHPRVRAQVVDIVAVPAVLGDEPEDLAIEPITD
jgi:hypothetical protein